MLQLRKVNNYSDLLNIVDTYVVDLWSSWGIGIYSNL